MKLRELRKLLENVSGDELEVLVTVELSEWSVKSGRALAHVRGVKCDSARIYVEADENKDCEEWKT